MRVCEVRVRERASAEIAGYILGRTEEAWWGEKYNQAFNIRESYVTMQLFGDRATEPDTRRRVGCHRTNVTGHTSAILEAMLLQTFPSGRDNCLHLE